MRALPMLAAGALILAAGFGAWQRAPRRDDPGEPPVAVRPAPDVAQPPKLALAERPAPTALRSQGGGAAQRAEPDARTAAERVAGLLAELEREAARPDEAGFLAGTARVLAPWHGSGGLADDPWQQAVPELLAWLDEQPGSPRVRGGVLALLGRRGRVEEVLERLPTDGVVWRMALQGLGSGGPAPLDALALDPAAFLDAHPRGALGALPWRLDTPPPGPWRAHLQRKAVTPVEDVGALLERELALLALATEIDRDEHVQALLIGLLFDPAPMHRQVREVLVFALGRGRSEAVRAALLAFLEDDQLGEWGKLGARVALAERAVGDELDVLAAPLRDAASRPSDRIVAAGLLMKRLAQLDPAAAAPMVELLAQRAEHEPDPVARLAAVSALGTAGAGPRRRGALERVLRRDPDAACRLWAVHGLVASDGGDGAEVRAYLEAARVHEQDARVLEALDQALGG